MGSCVIVFPNTRDYHFEILNPIPQLEQIISKHQMEIFQQIKIQPDATWQHLTIASLLLEKALKENQEIEKLIGGQGKKWIFVEQVTKEESMNAELYTLLQNKCKSVKSKDVLEVIEEGFNNKKLFTFEKPGLIYNINLDDPLDKRTCEEIPKEYLLLELKQTYNISIVRGKKVELLLESPYSQRLILQLIRNTFKQSEPVQTTFTTYSIINEIIKEGNYSKADILCSDLFGTQGCQAFKIPPTLIASSLSKFASQPEPTSSIYDQLQSVLLSFGINLGKLATQIAQRQNIKNAIFVSNEITHKRFLHFVATPFSTVGTIWFVQGQLALQKLYEKQYFN